MGSCLERMSPLEAADQTFSITFEGLFWQPLKRDDTVKHMLGSFMRDTPGVIG